MQQTYLKHKNLYWAILVALGLPSMAIATPTNNPPLTLNNLSGINKIAPSPITQLTVLVKPLAVVL